MESKLVEEFVIDGVIVEHLTTIKDINVYRTKERGEDYFLFFCLPAGETQLTLTGSGRAQSSSGNGAKEIKALTMQGQFSIL